MTATRATAPTVDLAYVGLGLHEQLVAHVAQRRAYFDEEGVGVTLCDGRQWPVERLRLGAVVGLGRTQVSRLRDGVPWVITCVNTDRPMFWLVARPGPQQVSDLRGSRIGLHDRRSAPGIWTRIVLRRHGLDPDVDIVPVPIPAGDYRTHLELLRAGELDAAVIGSTQTPEAMGRDDGLRVLSFFGDEIRIPTTGVAVDPTALDPEGEVVRGLVAAHRRALVTIVSDPDAAVGHIRELLPGATGTEATAHYERYVRPHFDPDGTTSRPLVEAGLAALATELGGATVPPIDDLYRLQLRAS